MQVCESVKREDFLELSNRDLENFYLRLFPSAAQIVHRLGGSLEDAKDIFHDALIIFHEILQVRKEIHSSNQAYIIGIVKHLAIRKFKQNKHLCSLNEMESHIKIPDDFYPSVNDKKLMRFLEKAGKKCMDLLQTFYHSMLPAREIAARFGYANEHSLSVQKYKCLDKLKAIVKQKSLEYDDFLE